ncbi:MAG: agmatinase family protein [Bacteroidetes bacterium]|nr:agmatinase family protein [Bacteroidota bacterium]
MIDKSQEYAYAGIPTFFKSDYGTVTELPGYDIGVFGVPTDTAASNRIGARLGPAAIRRASAFYNPQTYFKKETAIDMYQNQKVIDIDHPSILDLGDVTVYPLDLKKTLLSIESFMFDAGKLAFPVILGGDHSVTYPLVKGLVRGLKEKEKTGNIGIIHFDSHPDIWESYVTHEDVWHGSPFRNLLEDGIIKGENLVTVGDRSLLADYEYEYMNRHGVKLYSISDVWERGMTAVMEEAVSYLDAHCDGIYVSIDIDVMDPAYAPGTGTPAPGGLTPREMIQAVNIICNSKRLVGIDLVEVAPDFDPSECTANLAAFILHRFFILYKGFRKG